MENFDKTAYLRELGTRIRQRRESLGMSQEELADRVGYTATSRRSTISAIENGRYDPPAKKLPLYAEALGVTLDWLATGEDPAEKLADQTTDGLSATEEQLIALWRLVPEQSQRLVLDMIRTALKSQGLLE